MTAVKNEANSMVSRLQRKVAILEAMVEDRTRDAYLEQKRGAALIELHKESMRTATIEPLINRVLELVIGGGFLQVENVGAVFLSDVSGNVLVMKAQRNMPAEIIKSCQQVPFGRCLCGMSAAQGEVVFSRNVDHRHTCRYDGMAPHGHYCVPIKKERRTLGVINLHLPVNREKDDEELRFLEAVADIVAGCLQRLAYEEAINRYQTSLELMVQDQTRELRQTNLHLHQEIAERIQMEKALVEAEHRYRSIFENAVDGIYQSSLDGRMLACNQAFARILGFESPEEALARLDDVVNQLYVHPVDRLILLEKLRQAPVLGFETRMYRKDGGNVWVTINARLAGDSHSGTQFIEGILQDVSLRKEAEDALVTERERLAVTLASIGDGVITTDTEGMVVLVNPVAQRLTGWSQAEAEGRPLCEIFRIIDSRSRKLRDNPFDKVMDSDSIIELANHTVLISRSGAERSIADSGAPIRDNDNRIIGVVLVFRDVTEKERTEQELLKVKKLESVGVLAGGIAHDFNNILAAIVGNIHLAQRVVPENSGARQLLRDAEKASLRARDLTQQLLTFAKGGGPVKETASVGDIIKTSADFILRGSNVACHYDIPEDLWLVDIDTSQMSQVVQNIIINADQAMPKGGVVRISCENYRHEEGEIFPLAAGDYVCVTITDQGGGIPMEIIDRIFDPYFTNKPQGSGLGLAITHSIINKHDGHISVQSEPGMGASFSILLPASPRDRSLAENPDPSVTDQQGRGAYILLMDDDPMVRKVGCAMLAECGYRAVEAVDGAEAVALYRQSMTDGMPFDAVIMDLTVPGAMGGLEALQQLKEWDPEVTAIVSSGYSSDPVMANCKEYGFLAAVRKPYLLDELVLAVRQAMKN